MLELVLDPVLNRTGELWHIAGAARRGGGQAHLRPPSRAPKPCCLLLWHHTFHCTPLHSTALPISPPPPAVDGLADLEDLCYGWRLEGDVSWESGCRVQPGAPPPACLPASLPAPLLPPARGLGMVCEPASAACPLPTCFPLPPTADLLLVDPCCPALRYFPAEEAAVGAPLPLPTLTLSDGTAVAVASSLAGLAEEQARAHELAAMGPLAAAEAAAEAYVPPPDHALEELRLFDIDVRTFAQGELGALMVALRCARRRSRGYSRSRLRQAPAAACLLAPPCTPPGSPSAGKGVQHPGSFLGVAERVGHIKAMGANAVVLTPSYATAKGEPRGACCLVVRTAGRPVLPVYQAPRGPALNARLPPALPSPHPQASVCCRGPQCTTWPPTLSCLRLTAPATWRRPQTSEPW